MRKGAPFAGYEDFDACTSANSDKRSPDAYCGEIKHRTEDKEAYKLADVVQDYHDYLDKKPGLPTGGPADYQEFAQEQGGLPRVGPKLKYQPGVTPGGGISPSGMKPIPPSPKTPRTPMASRWFVADEDKKSVEPHGTGDVDQAPNVHGKGEDVDQVKGDAKSVEQVKGDPGSAERAPHTRKGKTALTAEPGFIYSKSPATLKREFANRLSSGINSDEVFTQIIGEINDHLRSGQINNRDAHRAANEAFGRLLMSRKLGYYRTLEVPHRNWFEKGPGGDAAYQDTLYRMHMHSDGSMVGREKIPKQAPPEPKQASRKQAWTGWGPSKKALQHKVAGWEWDDYQNGYLSNSPRRFQCSCGEPVENPSYTNCKCGKTWNVYVIGTGGDRREASAEKFIAREIPAREDVIVANKKRRPGQFYVKDLQFPEQTHYDDYDHALNDWESQDENERAFPSNHVPKVDTSVKGSEAGDWHRRDHKTQRWVQ